MTSVKVGLSVFVLAAISFAPGWFAVLTGQAVNGLFNYSIYLMNIGNIVVYLFVDKKFREALKSMCCRK